MGVKIVILWYDLITKTLQSYLKQSKKSKWLEKLAHKKGIALHSNVSIDEFWKKSNDSELKEVLDGGGYGNRPFKYSNV